MEVSTVLWVVSLIASPNLTSLGQSQEPIFVAEAINKAQVSNKAQISNKAQVSSRAQLSGRSQFRSGQSGAAQTTASSSTSNASSHSSVSTKKFTQWNNLQNAPNILAPFTTDGCSMWIDGTPSQPSLLRHCCVAHDRDYWLGGTAEERRESDQQLQKCITDIAGKIMGDYMYTFVIPGGSPYWLTPYRWGYGWSYLEGGTLRGYKNISDYDMELIKVLMLDAEKIIAQDAIDHPAQLRIPEKY